MATDQIAAALAERDAYLEPLGCSDGDCKVYNQRRGQHTNGGCRCMTDRMTAQRYAYANNLFADRVRAALTPKEIR